MVVQVAFITLELGKMSIRELAVAISTATGLNAPIEFDAARPDGQLLKVMEVSKAADEARLACRHIPAGWFGSDSGVVHQDASLW